MIEGFDDNQLKLGHLLLTDRTCRKCGQVKNLLDCFYRTRKDRGPAAASYSYECKECTKKRIASKRRKKDAIDRWEYPDW